MASKRGGKSPKKQEKPARKPHSGTPEAGLDKPRIDVVGKTNVYPMSGPEMPPSGDARIQPMGTFGQADRGPEGYYDTGPSEIMPFERFNREAGSEGSEEEANQPQGKKK
jgi:hypothetical protein